MSETEKTINDMWKQIAKMNYLLGQMDQCLRQAEEDVKKIEEMVRDEQC